jgi:hypothetical protein
MESILSDGTLQFDVTTEEIWSEPPAPPEPPDPLGPDHPPALRPEPLPWPDEPDWKRPVEIRFELEGHPAWPGSWQARGAAPPR